MKSIYFAGLFSAFIIFSSQSQNQKYQANWESLKTHNAIPEWLTDAKLGIYFHWGVYSVPAFGSEWYPCNMYIEGKQEFEHHKNTYGPQSEFGYHHFIPKFTAEHFNAEEWVQLFKKSGAKFAGPVAQHHDGFAMWDSKINPWNSVKKGPKKDITGELAKAIKANDMKLITTFHHARNLQRNANTPANWGEFNSHFTYNPNFHTATTDPELRILYGNIPEDTFHNNWIGQVNEVVNQYQPDMIWFDSWLNFIPEKIVQQMCADYFNAALKNNQKVAIGYKQSDLPNGVGILDIEQGGRRDIVETPWMTDITLSNKSWSYIEGQTYKTSKMVMRNLIDVVSKNGIVLLNISPKADGTIPTEQRIILEEMGEWFTKYGEAIYNTKPWDLFGFGNASAKEGHFGGQSAAVEYSASDIRFTQSKDEKSLYILFLGKPVANETVTMRLLAKHRYRPHTNIKRIILLGSNTELNYNFGNDSLSFTLPNEPMDEIATVLKLELE